MYQPLPSWTFCFSLKTKKHNWTGQRIQPLAVWRGNPVLWCCVSPLFRIIPVFHISRWQVRARAGGEFLSVIQSQKKEVGFLWELPLYNNYFIFLTLLVYLSGGGGVVEGKKQQFRCCCEQFRKIKWRAGGMAPPLRLIIVSVCNSNPRGILYSRVPTLTPNHNKIRTFFFFLKNTVEMFGRGGGESSVSWARAMGPGDKRAQSLSLYELGISGLPICTLLKWSELKVGGVHFQFKCKLPISTTPHCS